MDKKQLVEQIKSVTEPNHKGKYYALMLFETEIERGVSTNPNKWVNTGNAIFTNGARALNAYANTPCPASQLIDGKNPEELAENMLDMISNYESPEWLDENLYPYI